MAITYSPKYLYRTAAQRLRILDTTAITFTKCRATQAAASLAYYTFFSIFPLMLLFILGGSYFLDQQSVFLRVTQAVQGVLPISQQFITENLKEVLKQRTAVGIVVFVSLLWSASNMFNNLAFNINMAWPEARVRNFWQTRLIGLNMIASLTGLLLLSVGLDWLTKTLAGGNLGNGPFGNFQPWALISSLVSWIAIFLLYVAMYRWVPTISVAWHASLWGALAASIGWKAATTGFAWYLSSPFARYQLVYGSLGAIVAFLFLIYIIALVTLFGAHLTAAIDHLYHASVRAHTMEEAAIKKADIQENQPNGSQSDQGRSEPLNSEGTIPPVTGQPAEPESNEEGEDHLMPDGEEKPPEDQAG